jgi:hypothetical protein
MRLPCLDKRAVLHFPNLARTWSLLFSGPGAIVRPSANVLLRTRQLKRRSLGGREQWLLPDFTIGWVIYLWSYLSIRRKAAVSLLSA